MSQRPSSPFHRGEIRLQQSLGVAEQMAKFGSRVIRDYMPDQHRDFYARLPFVILGSVDAAGDCWITLRDGHPGFMRSPDPKTLSLSHIVDPSDPAVGKLAAGSAVGLLGIELHTRRRNRMNGRITAVREGMFEIEVEHAFGNCPQYIQRRDFTFVADPGDRRGSPEPITAIGIDAMARRMIAAADTFFVASYLDDEHGRHVDASHRGGTAGFVHINSDGALTIPDFAGNHHFNTLGNILLNPRTGLVFPDFATGDLLHLSGTAEIHLDSDALSAFPGAERLWSFHPQRRVLRRSALALRWTKHGG